MNTRRHRSPHSVKSDEAPGTDATGLRRELGLFETAAVSVGVMAPTLAMSVTGVAADLAPITKLARQTGKVARTVQPG